jgi:thiamine-monophosphate kinase
MSEQKLIDRYFNRPINSPNIVFGTGDDAALISLPPGHELASSIDTLVAGVNFPNNTHAEDIAYKAIAVSLSDMAAMGATPKTALISLTLANAEEKWLSAFSKGLYECLDAYNVDLIGGDITKGPLSITTVVNGFIPQGQALYRHGASPSDLVYVTEHLGDAGLGLQSDPNPSCLLALNRPTPRITTGIALRNIASAAIDISDGLATDLEKICIASQVGAKIQADQVPRQHASIEMALSAGDDFELCFTVPPEKVSRLEIALANTNCCYQKIGIITIEKSCRFFCNDGSPLKLASKGYDHF